MILALAVVRAAEPGIDASGMTIAPLDANPRDPLRVLRAGPSDAGRAFFGAAFGYAAAPDADLRGLTYVALNAGASLHDAFRVDLFVPMVATSLHPDGRAGPALGDTRMRARLNFITPERIVGGGGGPGVGVVGFVDLPSGVVDRSLSWGRASGGGGVVGTWELRRLTFSLEGTLEHRPTGDGLPEGGWAVAGGAAVGWLVTDGWGFTLEGSGRAPMMGTPGVRLGLSVRSEEVLAGVEMGLASARGIGPFRFVVGGSFPRRGTHGEPDLDREGSFALLDRCPLERETVNGYLDGDGCPDELSALSVEARYRGRTVPVRVTLRGGGQVREVDVGVDGLNMDVIPGSTWVAEARGRCIEGRGSARAAVEGAVLSIPMRPVRTRPVHVYVVDTRGDPVAAKVFFPDEGPCVPEGVLDVPAAGRVIELGEGTHRLTASAPGLGSRTVQVGEEDRLRVELEGRAIQERNGRLVLDPPPRFEGQQLLPESFAILDQLAAWLGQRPDVGIRIEAHTAAMGSDAVALRVSRARAEAVRTYLLGKGIEGRRIDTRAFGASRPIDTNRTERGRARNERVEFILWSLP